MSVAIRVVSSALVGLALAALKPTPALAGCGGGACAVVDSLSIVPVDGEEPMYEVVGTFAWRSVGTPEAPMVTEEGRYYFQCCEPGTAECRNNARLDRCRENAELFERAAVEGFPLWFCPWYGGRQSPGVETRAPFVVPERVLPPVFPGGVVFTRFTGKRAEMCGDALGIDDTPPPPDAQSVEPDSTPHPPPALLATPEPAPSCATCASGGTAPDMAILLLVAGAVALSRRKLLM